MQLRAQVGRVEIRDVVRNVEQIGCDSRINLACRLGLLLALVPVGAKTFAVLMLRHLLAPLFYD
jgi:hypothetical protein